MLHIPFAISALVAAVLAVPATAQLQVFGGVAPRMASTCIFWDNGPAGMLCVQYSQPDWQDKYDGMLPQLKGKQLRLGKDFWTTLNTTNALTIGATEVPAGSYYLGLKCDEAGGFHLLVLRAEHADAMGWAPFVADAWEPDYACAMERAKIEESAPKLTLAFAHDEQNPTQLTFTITWGTHQLVAPVTFHLADDAEAETVEEVETAEIEERD